MTKVRKMTRLIDADALYQVEKLLDTNIVRYDEIALNLLEQVLYDIQHFPTVTQPNEPSILDSRLTPKVMKGNEAYCHKYGK